MPRARNPQHRCKRSHEPETKEQRRERLAARREDQRSRPASNVAAQWDKLMLSKSYKNVYGRMPRRLREKGAA